MNPFLKRIIMNRTIFFISFLFFALIFSILLYILFYIVFKGFSNLNLEFLYTPSQASGKEGGILYQIIGSILLIISTFIISTPIAIGTSLYIFLYLKNPRLKTTFLYFISILNTFPSIIFGVFGLIFFVYILDFGISWISGACILSIMIIPTMIFSIYQLWENFPEEFIETGYSLGFNKEQIIIHILIPQSIRGIITGTFLGLARAIGETAPIMFTATVFWGPEIPASFLEPIVTLPTHILHLTQNANDPISLRNAWASSLILFSMVVLFNIISFILRIQIQKKRGNI